MHQLAPRVFSLAQRQFEKYGSRASNKPCDFNYIKNPYQIPVVQRSREKPRRENTSDVVLGIGSAELRSESLAKRGDFRQVTSHERKLATTWLAEGEELESNILQLCPPSKCVDSEAFCMAIMPRGAFSEAAGRGGQVRIPLSPPNPQVSAVSQSSPQSGTGAAGSASDAGRHDGVMVVPGNPAKLREMQRMLHIGSRRHRICMGEPGKIAGDGAQDGPACARVA
jgi:hypothetical protein